MNLRMRTHMRDKGRVEVYVMCVMTLEESRQPSNLSFRNLVNCAEVVIVPHVLQNKSRATFGLRNPGE